MTSSPWLRRLSQPEWALLPLRAFLGVTFTFAGLQKLADPGYLDPLSPVSAAHQMLLLRGSSPIGPLLDLSGHAPTLVSLMIAIGELSVGLGTLLGLWARVAAAGGALLALSFFLTVSWNTTPYYYGADIVFFFAWLVMFAFGAPGRLTADAWLRNRARSALNLGPEPALVAVAVPRLRDLCGQGKECALTPGGHCAQLSGCPVFPVQEKLPSGLRNEIDRRSLVAGGFAAGVVALFALALGGVTAVIGRVVGGTTGKTTPIHPAAPPPSTPLPSTPPPSTPPTGPPATTSAPRGTAVGAVSAVPVGHGLSFTNAADGNPSWVVHSAKNTFVAFSAVCTHAGCTVQYDQATTEFTCPCHGGVYDARTGQVLQGPPPAPLPSIPVHVDNGEIRVN